MIRERRAAKAQACLSTTTKKKKYREARSIIMFQLWQANIWRVSPSRPRHKMERVRANMCPRHPFGTRLFDEASSQQKDVGVKKRKIVPRAALCKRLQSLGEQLCLSQKPKSRKEQKRAETALFSFAVPQFWNIFAGKGDVWAERAKKLRETGQEQ